MSRSEIRVILVALLIIFIVTTVTIFVVQMPFVSTLIGLRSSSETEGADNIEPISAPTPSPAVRTLVDTDSFSALTLESTALGFTFDYPAGWRKKETTLYAIVSPSKAGLEPLEFGDSALWVGIPASDSYEPVVLLNEIIAQFAPTSLSQTTVQAGDKRWEAVQLEFTLPNQATPGRALVAATSHNQVGYFVIAAAPIAQWDQIEPTFNQIFDSIRFLQQGVLRPTDATPPPTPTPTPTPVVYVVQSGDTLFGISLQYGVEMEALMNRNGLEDASFLRTGQKLVIPVPRR